MTSFKNQIDLDSIKIDNKTTSTMMGKKSIYFSIIMIVYAFFVIGSSIETHITILSMLRDTIRILAIFFGLYLFYLNFYMTHLQLNLNRKWLGYLALVMNVISLLYFFLVSFSSIVEIRDTIVDKLGYIVL